MSYWLWRGFLICLLLGGLQWGYTHPDAELTQAVIRHYHAAIDAVKNAYVDARLYVLGLIQHYKGK